MPCNFSRRVYILFENAILYSFLNTDAYYARCWLSMRCKDVLLICKLLSSDSSQCSPRVRLYNFPYVWAACDYLPFWALVVRFLSNGERKTRWKIKKNRNMHFCARQDPVLPKNPKLNFSSNSPLSGSQRHYFLSLEQLGRKVRATDSVTDVKSILSF